MVNINSAFPSDYLKASDLQGRNVTVIINHVEWITLGQGKNTEEKLCVYFQGKEKGLVLNKTNANNIAAMYGEETDQWTGQPVLLFEAMVDYQGRSVPAIRVRGVPGGQPAAVRTPPARQAAAHPNAPSVKGVNFAELDDEIPF